MSAEKRIRFEELDALGATAELLFRDGFITLNDERMVLLHAHVLGALRRELVRTVGMEKARGVLTRMGYASGAHDAEMTRRRFPHRTPEENLYVGPALHRLEGSVNVRLNRVEVDREAGRCLIDASWNGSYEAELHLESYGVHTGPVCWTQLGYATGFTSSIFGFPVHYREVACRGHGDEDCRLIGKSVSEWDHDTLEAELAYYRSDPVAEQLMALEEQVATLRETIEERQGRAELVGRSEGFRRVCELTHKAAASDVTVLLLGETGVGKEEFAKEIHRHSPRNARPMVTVNCAAIPADLIEAELFGVEKGAYTGAVSSRAGRFERADGGTLFLDEVGELSPSAQAKLLRVLADGIFERVGGTRPRRADVRIVAATNRELGALVDTGGFRSDLFYRLSVFPMRVPPLRERKADIPLLAERFLERFRVDHGRATLKLTDSAMAALSHYHWPGNIRELRNVLERGAILADRDGLIHRGSLFPATDIALPQAFPAAARAPRDTEGLVAELLDAGEDFEAVEAAMFREAVRRCGGNLSEAAKRLGLTRATLAYRLKKNA